MDRRSHSLAGSGLNAAAVLLLVLTIAGNTSRGAEPAPDFVRDVQPIFEQHCRKCHGPEKQQGKLRFDHRAGTVREGDSGVAAVVPGMPDESELLNRVRSTDDSIWMPPEGDRLSPSEISILSRWIESGAEWPASAEAKPTGRQELVVTDADQQHWSFLPLRDVVAPVVKDQAWPVTPIDVFLRAAQEEQGVAPSAAASPRVLARRIYFDLTGLPPTPEQISAFEVAAARDRPGAVLTLCDELLSRPQYGERWGRHWLDVARYADSAGQEADHDRPFAYPYRDFVIRALNDDLPFDQFVRWQLAGDEYEPDSPLAVAATGFLTAGPNTLLDVPMEEEKVRNRYNELDDMVSTIGSGLLGLTLGCARCHDHKYDPIPTRDYYSLLAALHSGDRQEVWLGARDEVTQYVADQAEWQRKFDAVEKEREEWYKPRRSAIEKDLRAKKVAALNLPDDETRLLLTDSKSTAGKDLAKEHAKAIAVSEAEVRAELSAEEQGTLDRLTAARDAVKAEEPTPLPRALSFRDFGPEVRETWLFERGDFYDRDEPLSLEFLQVLEHSRHASDYWSNAKAALPWQSSTGQRRALADWITDVDQGAGALLARVIVNRVWQHHFGEGLVRSTSDFGVQGEPPTHPELLEWLAHDFVSHGWRLKRLHGLVIASAAYQQGTDVIAANVKVDPDNRLLWRRRPQRIEAEALRDAMLSVAGTLNPASYGPAFKPPIAAEAMSARNIKDPYPTEVRETDNERRRSVYMFHKRIIPYPLLQAFDRPEALQSCARRDATTVAPQALALLNDSFVRTRAREFAQRVLTPEGISDGERVEKAFELALGRVPSADERMASLQFLQQQATSRQTRLADATGDATAEVQGSTNDSDAWADFCQALFGLNEFLYID